MCILFIANTRSCKLIPHSTCFFPVISVGLARKMVGWNDGSLKGLLVVQYMMTNDTFRPQRSTSKPLGIRRDSVPQSTISCRLSMACTVHFMHCWEMLCWLENEFCGRTTSLPNLINYQNTSGGAQQWEPFFCSEPTEMAQQERGGSNSGAAAEILLAGHRPLLAAPQSWSWDR